MKQNSRFHNRARYFYVGCVESVPVKVLVAKKGNTAYTVKEMTVLLKPKKRKEDGRMPTKRVDIIAVFDLWMGRPNMEHEAIEREAAESSESGQDCGEINNESCIENNQSTPLLM